MFWSNVEDGGAPSGLPGMGGRGGAADGGWEGGVADEDGDGGAREGTPPLPPGRGGGRFGRLKSEETYSSDHAGLRLDKQQKDGKIKAHHTHVVSKSFRQCTLGLLHRWN